ncbi:phosphoglycerate kinase, partial [mine drainage metagenome]
MDLYRKYPDRIILPDDAVLNPSGRRIEIGSNIPDSDLIADIGVDTIVKFSGYIKKADAIFMNGPMGMYEIDQYSVGTREVFSEVAESGALTIAGGGHTLSALERMELMRKITHASTGGGALISYLSGEHMPVLDALR